MGVFRGCPGSTPKGICPCDKSLKMHRNRNKINGIPPNPIHQKYFYGYIPTKLGPARSIKAYTFPSKSLCSLI